MKRQPVHTARVGEKLYNIDMLEKYAEELPVEEIPVSELREAVAEGHKYWLDENGEMFGPAEMLRDWDAAERNLLWIQHVESIRHANLSNPLWLAADGFVFDGMHRLTRAFVDGVQTVKARRFQNIPDWAIVRED